MAEKVITAGEFVPVVVDLATDSTTINTKPTMLRGISIKTAMSAHDCPVYSGTVALFTIPASSQVGTWFPFGDVIMGAGIIIDPNNSATGEITVIMKELP